MAVSRSTLSLVWALPLGLTLSCTKRAPTTNSPLVKVNEGSFWMGSDSEERAEAIEQLATFDPASWRHVYAWIKNELPRQKRSTSSYEIMRLAVSQYDYYKFVRATGHPEPFVDAASWDAMQTNIPYDEARAFFWEQGRPAKGRARHPVTFVSHIDAQRYCAWWGEQLGGRGRLPTEDEWERAARGDTGQYYPWGNEFRPAFLNAYESNLAQTTPVSAYAEGVSPYGALGMAGNVLEWTATPEEDQGFIVKGGAFELSAAMARPAARHTRPASQKHMAIGFRCIYVRDIEPKTAKPSSATPSPARARKEGQAPQPSPTSSAQTKKARPAPPSKPTEPQTPASPKKP